VALCLRSRAKIQREQVKIMPPKRGTAESKLPIDEKCLHGTLGACKPTHARCRRGSELTPVQAASKGCCVQRPCRVQPKRRAQRSHPSARWCNGGFAWADAPALCRASEGTLTSRRRKLQRAAAHTKKACCAPVLGSCPGASLRCTARSPSPGRQLRRGTRHARRPHKVKPGAARRARPLSHRARRRRAPRARRAADSDAST
jgi:hypothetical protein